MYNRYIPSSNGQYHKQTICEQSDRIQDPLPSPPVMQETKQQQSTGRPTGLLGLDWGDLLLICVIILLLLEAESDETLPILIMAGAFLLLQ